MGMYVGVTEWLQEVKVCIVAVRKDKLPKLTQFSFLLGSDVCYVGQDIILSMNRNSSFDIEFWANDLTSADELICHFWCNEQENLPKKKFNSSMPKNLITKVVT